MRGTIRAALGTGAIEVDVPPEGLPLSDVLAGLADAAPRAARVLLDSAQKGSLRVVLNGSVLDPGDDAQVQAGDTLLLLVAMAGG